MPIANPRVLVIEDDPAIRTLVSIALRRKNLVADCVSDGIAALDMLNTATQYAAILVDLMMPRMNGFAFLDAFARLALAPAPVVFVMTAYDDSAFGKLDAAIVHGCFRKPFDVEQVAQTISDCAVSMQERIEETESDRRRAASAPEVPLRVLVVEDEPDYRAWLVALTRRLGCSVDFARDGLTALDQLAHDEYDIVVIDHEMPRMSGVELIDRIRDDDRTAALYALMLTGRDDFDSKLHALGAGFDDFVSKGAPEAEIVARLGVARRIATRQRSMDAAIHELRGLATRDELTGVFNRRVFAAETERMLGLGAVLNVVLFDLDDFKQVNDTFGHLVGDRVLRDVGAVFHRHTRPEDLIARYGGDEFVMVVPDLEVSAIETLAQRLSREVHALQWHAGQVEPFSISVTTGMASSRLLAEPTVAQLLDAADRDLYKNKWIRTHPSQRLELYEYPEKGRAVDLVRPAGESMAEPRRPAG